MFSKLTMNLITLSCQNCKVRHSVFVEILSDNFKLNKKKKTEKIKQ